MIQQKRIIISQDNGALDNVLEFTHVAGPTVFQHHVLCHAGDTLDLFIEVLIVHIHKM